MPGIDITDDTVTFSQSWLGNFVECPAKARWQIDNPRERDADYHVTGTALHTFIEGVLMGDTVEAAAAATFDWLDEQVENQTFDYVKVKTPGTMRKHLQACMDAFMRDVWRHLNPEGPDVLERIEQSFDMPLITAADGTELRLKGTTDYEDPYLGQMDWKTAGREWVPNEKQKWAIQPTAYTLARVYREYGEELWTFADDEFVAGFTYCIHLKRPTPQPVQWVSITRGPADWRHLQRVALNAYDCIKADVWPALDHSHLCSPVFCPNWGDCKGSPTLSIVPNLRLVRDTTNNEGEQQ